MSRYSGPGHAAAAGRLGSRPGSRRRRRPRRAPARARRPRISVTRSTYSDVVTQGRGVGVVDGVGEHAPDVRGVERHFDHAQASRAPSSARCESNVFGQQGRDVIAGAHAERFEGRGPRASLIVELGVGERVTVDVLQARPRRASPPPSARPRAEPGRFARALPGCYIRRCGSRAERRTDRARRPVHVDRRTLQHERAGPRARGARVTRPTSGSSSSPRARPVSPSPKTSAAGARGCSMSRSRVEVLGARLAPVPLVEHTVAARLLARASGTVPDGVVDGSTIATLALRPPIDGVARLVPAGAVADVVVALDGDDLVAVTATATRRRRSQPRLGAARPPRSPRRRPGRPRLGPPGPTSSTSTPVRSGARSPAPRSSVSGWARSSSPARTSPNATSSARRSARSRRSSTRWPTSRSRSTARSCSPARRRGRSTPAAPTPPTSVRWPCCSPPSTRSAPRSVASTSTAATASCRSTTSSSTTAAPRVGRSCSTRRRASTERLAARRYGAARGCALMDFLPSAAAEAFRAEVRELDRLARSPTRCASRSTRPARSTAGPCTARSASAVGSRRRSPRRRAAAVAIPKSWRRSSPSSSVRARPTTG